MIRQLKRFMRRVCMGVKHAKIYRARVEGGLDINEYVNGEYVVTHSSLSEAAEAHRVSVNAIKNCLASGLPLSYRGRDSITFDTPYDSPYYYEFIPDEKGNLKATLFIEVK